MSKDIYIYDTKSSYSQSVSNDHYTEGNNVIFISRGNFCRRNTQIYLVVEYFSNKQMFVTAHNHSSFFSSYYQDFI